MMTREGSLVPRRNPNYVFTDNEADVLSSLETLVCLGDTNLVVVSLTIKHARRDLEAIKRAARILVKGEARVQKHLNRFLDKGRGHGKA